jgi:hypothetical protein
MVTTYARYLVRLVVLVVALAAGSTAALASSGDVYPVKKFKASGVRVVNPQTGEAVKHELTAKDLIKIVLDIPLSSSVSSDWKLGWVNDCNIGSVILLPLFIVYNVSDGRAFAVGNVGSDGERNFVFQDWNVSGKRSYAVDYAFEDLGEDNGVSGGSAFMSVSKLKKSGDCVAGGTLSFRMIMRYRELGDDVTFITSSGKALIGTEALGNIK